MQVVAYTEDPVALVYLDMVEVMGLQGSTLV